MKSEIKLRFNTPQAWVNTVLANFDSFLQDHADCERKASSMAMSFVAKCPDKVDMIPHLIETALEELVHFKQVYELMDKRGIQLPAAMDKDPYITKLMKLPRSGVMERLLDRMLLASIVEMRGAERFRMVAENLKDVELKKFYTILYKSEEKHGDVFIELARKYWNEQEIWERLDFLLDKEAEIVKTLPLRAALH